MAEYLTKASKFLGAIGAIVGILQNTLGLRDAWTSTALNEQGKRDEYISHTLGLMASVAILAAACLTTSAAMPVVSALYLIGSVLWIVQTLFDYRQPLGVMAQQVATGLSDKMTAIQEAIAQLQPEPMDSDSNDYEAMFTEVATQLAALAREQLAPIQQQFADSPLAQLSDAERPAAKILWQLQHIGPQDNPLSIEDIDYLHFRQGRSGLVEAIWHQVNEYADNDAFFSVDELTLELLGMDKASIPYAITAIQALCREKVIR